MKKILFLTTALVTAQAFSQPLTNEKPEMLTDVAFTLPATYTTVKLNKREAQRIALKTGVELEYVEQGSKQGVPVIFLHGITDSWHSFESTLPHLPSSLHAFALTQRGHGNSGKPGTGYTPKHFAADVADFIQQKKLGPSIIVGHSMGGVVAQQFAILYPQLTKSLVIVCSDPAIKQNPGMPEFYQEVLKMKGPQSREFFEEFQKGTIFKPIDSAYLQLLIDESLKVPHSVFVAAFKGLMDADLSLKLKSVKCPSLVFWGNKDAFFHAGGQELLRKNLRGAQWKTYEDIGHALHWEEPERFAKDLVSFIQSGQLNPPEKETKTPN